MLHPYISVFFFFFQAEDGIRDSSVTGVQTCALPISTSQGNQGSPFSVSGARSDNNNYVVDGFNDQNVRGGGPQTRPNLDAMREFKMQTSNYSAEYGRLAGPVLNMALKSGGNKPHGVLFEFL